MKTNQAFCYTLALLATILFFGCKSKPVTQPPPTAATPAEVQAIRHAYFRAYPDSRVGVVNVSDKGHKLVSVTEVNGAEFREGETVTFIDSRQRVLATGTIVRVLPNQVHVTYEKVKGGRDPVVGDVMVRLPFGATTL